VGDRVLCGERGQKLSGRRYSVLFCEVGEIELWAIRNERKILPTLKASTMNAAPVTTSSRAIRQQLL